MVITRSETLIDHEAVHRVNEQAFGRPDESDLVERLREVCRPYISLVAELDGRVVGHIFFSPVTIEPTESAVKAMGLAPMAVLPEHQRKGIGSLLVRDGLKECGRSGYDAVFVLGHPDYYPRFGFAPAARKGFRSEYDVPDDVFMVVELTEGSLKDRSGLVRYHPEFGGE